MADNTLKTRLLSAYNTADFWSTCTIVPLSGEVCYTVDNNNKILEIKIGNGIDTYAQLPAQSFDSADHLYKLSTPVSTAADASNFTATTYLQVNDGLGSTSYDNSSSAVLTIPSATTSKAGLMSASDKEKLEKYGVPTTSIGTPSSTSKNIPTDYAVWKAIDDMPEPMLFKGSVGTGGTTASLPTTGLSAYEGWTYKVITDGTYGGVAAKVGDSLICNGSEWVLIPSGDEPSGTVTSVGIKSTTTSVLGASGTVTSSGTLEVSHKTSGVTSGGYGDSTHVFMATVDSYGHITSATTAKIPSATTAAEGLTKKPSGTAPIAVSADNVISHNNSGVTAGTYGAAQTASFAGNVAIPSIKIDAKGHVTTAGTVNVKMPSTAGLGTSAKDIASVTFKANTSGSNNDFGVIVALNDGTNVTTASSIITSTIVLDGNFTS